MLKSKTTDICNGCGCEIMGDLPDKSKNELYGTKIHLILCYTCKCTMIKELLESQHPNEYNFIKNLLNEEVIRLNIELKRIGDVWKKHLGEPLTKERLVQHNDKPLSVSYLDKLQGLEECKRVLKLIT